MTVYNILPHIKDHPHDRSHQFTERQRVVVMQNQAAVEALYSATFVEDYLDFVENVPDDLQRHHSRLRELDMSQHQELLSELDALTIEFEAASDDPVLQRRLLAKMQLPLINSQDIGDSKIQLVQSLTDTIENKTR